MNLEKLENEFFTGKRVDRPGAESVTIMTPVARASFCALAEPVAYKGSAPRYGLSLIFNRDQAAPAYVDPVQVILPAFAEAAQKNALPIEKDEKGVLFGKDRERERCRAIHYGVRDKQEDGTPLDGYTPLSLWLSAYKRAGGKGVPTFGPNGLPITPSEILSGYYVRAVIQPYKPKNWSMLAIGLVSVQLVAEGPTFGSDTAVGYDAIPGSTNSDADFSQW